MHNQKMMRLINLILRVNLVIFSMLMTGNKISKIKSRCLLEYAKYLYDRKNSDEKAILFYKKAINLDSNNYYAYGSLATALLRKNQVEQALVYCKKANTIKPGVTVNMLLFVIYDVLGERNSSEEVLHKILEYYENNLVTAYDRLAFTFYSVNMFQKAEYYCNEALKIYPNAASLHHKRARILLAQDKFTDAKDEFEKVAKLANTKRYKRYAKKEIISINKRMHL